ncbi:MAG: HAD-IIA family hydrolase [Micromonosporaceae bacterium]
MARVRAVLIDIDGVLTVSWRALPGTVAAMESLRASGVHMALLTNTTSRTRAAIGSLLAAAGFQVGVGQILTAPTITAAYIAARYPGARCLLLNSGDIREDMAGILIADNDDPAPDVVVIGGAGPEFSYHALNRAFGHLRRGARFVAMHRSLYWRTDAGLQLDGGAFVEALERAAGVTAEVTGKPAAAFFEAALANVGVGAGEAVMVGDDIEADVLAAQRIGITGVLVRTGKYLAETHENATGAPDHVLGSFADLPALLAALPA